MYFSYACHSYKYSKDDRGSGIVADDVKSFKKNVTRLRILSPSIFSDNFQII